MKSRNSVGVTRRSSRRTSAPVAIVRTDAVVTPKRASTLLIACLDVTDRVAAPVCARHFTITRCGGLSASCAIDSEVRERAAAKAATRTNCNVDVN